MIKAATVVALAVSFVAALALTLLSANSFVVARGSDAAVQIYTLPLYAKLLTLLVVAAAWTASAAAKRLGGVVRWALRIAGVSALVLGTHVISLNFKRGELEDHWLLVRLDRASFNVAEGLAQDWRVEPVPFGYELLHRTNGTRRFLFSGIPPWKLDLGPNLTSDKPPQ